MREQLDYDKSDAASDKLKGIGKKIGNLIWFLILLAVMFTAVWTFVLRLNGDTPSLGGMRLYRVVTGSMEPVYGVGDVVLVRTVPVTDLQTGDDITYISRDGETAGMAITHRLVEQPYQDADSVWHLQTSGIIEGIEADPPITGDQVIGKVIKNCRIITVVYQLFLTKAGLVLFLLPLLLMMAAEVRNIIALARK